MMKVITIRQYILTAYWCFMWLAFEEKTWVLCGTSSFFYSSHAVSQVWQDSLTCSILLLGSRKESSLSRRHWLIGVKVDPLGAGNLHHSSMQAGVGNQPDHALRYQWRSGDKRGPSVMTLWSSWIAAWVREDHGGATYSYVSIISTITCMQTAIIYNVAASTSCKHPCIQFSCCRCWWVGDCPFTPPSASSRSNKDSLTLGSQTCSSCFWSRP